MMQRIWGGSNNPEVHGAISRWVSLHSFGHPDNVWMDSSSFGVMKSGVPVAGFIYHDYKPSAGTIQYSGAATDRAWLKGPSLHMMFGYIFEDLGCQMALTGNSSRNTGLHRLLDRLDHTKHVIKRGWGRDEDLFLWTLTQEKWAENSIMQRSKKWAKESNHV